jgi:prepilin-type N-terminal cleavage/methylation domain-containing protein
MGENITTSSRTRFERGYTMIEVIVAASIMSVMFVSLYTGISFGFSVSRTERENLRATQIILERMEGIRLFTYDQLSNTNLNPPVFTQNYYPQALGSQSQGITYTGSMIIESNITLDPSATYSTSMKRITVGLKWVSGGAPRSRSIVTYAARNGIQNYVTSTNN